MLDALANCHRCYKTFHDYNRRGLCSSCFGEKVFGKKIETVQAPSEPIKASESGLTPPTHLLRCEILAQKGRAHQPAVRRGLTSFW